MKPLELANIVNMDKLEQAFEPYKLQMIKPVKVAKDASTTYDPNRPDDFLNGFLIALREETELERISRIEDEMIKTLKENKNE